MRMTEIRCDHCGEVVDQHDAEQISVTGHRAPRGAPPRPEALDLCRSCSGLLSDAFALYQRRWATVLINEAQEKSTPQKI